ncbi:ATP synthase subunit C [Thioalkalicoccus limnaeus]|uniref:ATP synthase subunit C n=1 Tax=Thioalkalicoccus limnaeus TaxID=120681 RepID=A0ABV4BJD5_9GAMM
MSRQASSILWVLLGLTLVTGLATLVLWYAPTVVAEDAAVGLAATAVDPGVLRWGFIAAALATGLAALGAAYAVAVIGAAAVGALTEKPELFGRVIILVGLAEGIAIYGVIVSVLILNRLG